MCASCDQLFMHIGERWKVLNGLEVHVQFYKREVTRMNAEILALRAHIEKLQKEQVPADSTSSDTDSSVEGEAGKTNGQFKKENDDLRAEVAELKAKLGVKVVKVRRATDMVMKGSAMGRDRPRSSYDGSIHT